MAACSNTSVCNLGTRVLRSWLLWLAPTGATRYWRRTTCKGRTIGHDARRPAWLFDDAEAARDELAPARRTQHGFSRRSSQAQTILPLPPLSFFAQRPRDTIADVAFWNGLEVVKIRSASVRVRVAGTFGGKPFDVRERETDVLHWEAGGWKIILTHETFDEPRSVT
jgi:hypothetical protein